MSWLGEDQERSAGGLEDDRHRCWHRRCEERNMEKRMSNWKALGPDMVRGFNSLHALLTTALKECVE